MPKHSRWPAEHHFMPGDIRNNGYYSRRNRSGDPYRAYRASREKREKKFFETMQLNRLARSQRTPQEQLAVLDERLGENSGAKKERVRLKALIEEQKNKKKPSEHTTSNSHTGKKKHRRKKGSD